MARKDKPVLRPWTGDVKASIVGTGEWVYKPHKPIVLASGPDSFRAMMREVLALEWGVTKDSVFVDATNVHEVNSTDTED